MKIPQVINFNSDTVMAFDGNNVIDDTDQLPIANDHSIYTITVSITMWDLVANVAVAPISVTMYYQSDVDIWTIELWLFISKLIDKHKYIALVSATDSSNMRSFKINEFSIDNDSFEDTWMGLPYQVEVSGGEAWIRWYATIENFGNLENCKFQAKAFEGGIGITYATDPSRVTHRGPVVPYILVGTTPAP